MGAADARDSGERSAEDVIADNMKNAAERDQNFVDEYFSSVRSDKARSLYPERGGNKYEPSWWDIAIKGDARGTEKLRCERNVYNVLTNSKLVKILLGALESSGCKIDIRRHISCEVCHSSVTGGYDPFLNQVVVCQNMCKSEAQIQGVLTHEFIHMFDYCRKKLDLNNIQHLACTEIRAANLAHCSFLGALASGSVSPFSIKQSHQNCVKQKAAASIMAVKNVSEKEAYEAVESVFSKCYNDLEPLGRRLRRNSDHISKAYLDRLNMGYK